MSTRNIEYLKLSFDICKGNPTRKDRPGDMYDAATVGAEKDSGPTTAVAINGIGIQVRN